MRKLLIILFLIFISNQGFTQNIISYKNFKLFDLDLSTPKVQSEKYSRIIPNITVNPTTSKYPVSNFYTDIIVAGDTVWFATGSGIMRTIDNFRNFQSYFGLEPFGDDDISGFHVNKRIVVGATAISEEISGESVPTGTGIKVSTDYGVNWNAYPQPVDQQSDTIIQYGSNNIRCLPVVVRQQNLSYDVAITKNQNDTNNFTIWITSFAGGLRKSTDYGQTWIRVVLPPDNLDSIYPGGTYNFTLDPRINLNHRAFTVLGVDDSVIYVGTANGINRSTDYGVSWRKFTYQNSGGNNNGNGVSGNFVVDLYAMPYGNQKIIWGATRRAEDNNEKNGLSYSANGTNWNYTLKDVSTNGITSKDSIVYGLTSDGLYRAKYLTFDWSSPPLIFDEQTKDKVTTKLFYSGAAINDSVYFGSADGLLRTIETGLPWVSKWKIFRAISPINFNSDLKTYAAPNPFAPDDEVVRIFYKTNKLSAKVTINVFDFAMNPVRTVIQNATRTGMDELYTQWDGKDDKGSRIANGVYFYRIKIDNETETWGKILVIQ
ncbi:MAG TPA: hypothetical protein PLG90_10960 [Ignavibacteria bacterium]|nr:hypothetical protein [Ignavibacteria bacterium]